MNVRLDEDGTLVVEFPELEPLQAFLDSARAQNGFYLTLPRELRMFQRLPLSLRQGTRFAFSVEAEVIQIFPAGPDSFGTAFQIVDWSKKKELELERALREAARPEAAAGAAPAGDVPILFSLKEMDVSQKMRLAMKATKMERALLAQDHSPQVLMALMANPRIEEEEVLQIVKSIHASSGVLQHVANAQRWGAVYDIQLALVRNARTPTQVVLKLLETLRTGDLGILAKGGGAKEVIRKAALRIYLKRTSSR